VAVPVILHILEMVEQAEKHKGLTEIQAAVTVGAEGYRGGLATCACTMRWRSERGHQRITTPMMSVLANDARTG
jgi:hypothetical protein